ncbi:hypothetical protein LINPERHAP1_LOCUS4466, partial [Linum perenne]
SKHSSIIVYPELLIYYNKTKQFQNGKTCSISHELEYHGYFMYARYRLQIPNTQTSTSRNYEYPMNACIVVSLAS